MDMNKENKLFPVAVRIRKEYSQIYSIKYEMKHFSNSHKKRILTLHFMAVILKIVNLWLINDILRLPPAI